MLKIPSDLMSIVIVFLVSVLIGLTIVKIVETRMSDISIKMPTINLPEQQITVQMSPGGMTGTKQTAKVTYEHIGQDPKPLKPPTDDVSGAGAMTGTSQIAKVAYDPVQQGGSASMLCSKDLPPARTHYNPDNYHSLSGPVKKLKSDVPPAVSKAGQSSHPTPTPRKAPSLTEPQPKPTGITYYLDPKQMTPAQLVKFQQRAKFTNMTVKDYENWLGTFRDDPGRLNGFHRSNLKVLMRGGHLSPTDMPSRHKVPDSGADQYTQIMQGADWEQVPHPEFAGYEPWNFDQYISQPEVKPNRNLRHLDYVNPDEPMKTWILTRDSKKLGTV